MDFVDAFGHKQLTGTAAYLAQYVANEIGCKTRAIELSTLQRSASHCASRVDILEAFQVGGAAVKAADEGDNGKMVVLKRISDDPYQCSTEVKDVHKIANDEKLVPREWVNEDGTYVTDDFVACVKPLIQETSPRLWWMEFRDTCTNRTTKERGAKVKIGVTGADGFLGSRILRFYEEKYEMKGYRHSDMDLQMKKQ